MQGFIRKLVALVAKASTTEQIDDAYFGPQFGQEFDFTMVFDNTILTIIPATIMIGAAPVYMFWYHTAMAKTSKRGPLWVKLMVAVGLVLLELIRSIVWKNSENLGSPVLTSTTISAKVLSTTSAGMQAVALCYDHLYAAQSTTFLSIFLTLSTIAEGTRTRSFFLRNDPEMTTVAGLSLGCTILNALLVVLLELPKTLDSPQYRHRNLVPDATIGFWGRVCLFWVNSLFFQGFRGTISMNDLAELGPASESENLADEMEQTWRSTDKTHRYALAKTCLSVLRWPLLSAWVTYVMISVLAFTNVFVIQVTLDYMENLEEQPYIARGLIGANVIMYALAAILNSAFSERNNQLAIRIRGALTSMMVQKTMRLPMETARQSAALTLMNADIAGIIDSIPNMFSITLIIPELAIAFYCLWTVIGNAFFLTVIPLIVSTINGYLSGSTMSVAMKQWNRSIQERVSKTANVLLQVKAIKMIGLEAIMTRFLNNLRESEISDSMPVRKLRVIVIASLPINYWFTPAVAFLGAVYWTVWKDGLDPVGIWVALNFVDLVRTPMWFLLRFWNISGEFFACIERIQDFLVLEERQDIRELRQFDNARGSITTEKEKTSLGSRTSISSIEEDMGRRCISVENVTVASNDPDRNILNEIDLSIPAGKLTLLVGRVGAGKSVFLKTLLGEITPQDGAIQVSSFRMAYCGQNTWLPDDTLQDVITMHTEFDEDRFNMVIAACDFEKDLQAIGGRQAAVGSNGSKLSGGQKQRVALARAIYSSCPILIVDDILSALDSQTAVNIFKAVFGVEGLLKKEGRTAIMATHERRFIFSADQIIWFNGQGAASVFKGREAIQTFSENEGVEVGTTYFITAEQEQEPTPDNTAEFYQDLEYAREDEQKSERKLEMSLYRYLFRTVSTKLTVLVIVSTFMYGFMERCPELYIRLWVEFKPSNKALAWGMLAAGALAILIAGGQAWIFHFKVVPKISRKTHATFTNAVLMATLPFLTSTSNGGLLNRFSQDMTILGQELPVAVHDTLRSTSIYITNLAFVVAGTSYTAITIPFVLLVLWFLQKFYLRTSQQMRILDLEGKTPLFTLINDTNHGIEHVRSFGMQRPIIKRSYEKLDYSQRPYYFLLTIQRWLLLVLDVLGLVIATILVSIAMLATHSTSQAGLGLALYNMTYFSNLSRSIIQRWTSLETSLGAAARLRDFDENTPSERDAPNRRDPPPAWPNAGRVEFKNVSVKYGTERGTPFALERVSAMIEPREKVVLTGRTGSGKSTVLLSMLNLLNITSGKILIDNIDITTIRHEELRKRITTLPQDSIDISGTVWNNLLPFNILEDNNGGNVVAEHTVVDILQDIGLWDLIEIRGGLHAPIKDMHLSSGQKQILSIARAMIHHMQFDTKIVLMDEATSSLDAVTNEVVQQMMERTFRGSTWIIISHDTRAVADCELVLTFGSGLLIETELVEAMNEEQTQLFNDATGTEPLQLEPDPEFQQQPGPAGGAAQEPGQAAPEGELPAGASTSTEPLPGNQADASDPSRDSTGGPSNPNGEGNSAVPPAAPGERATVVPEGTEARPSWGLEEPTEDIAPRLRPKILQGYMNHTFMSDGTTRVQYTIRRSDLRYQRREDPYPKQRIGYEETEQWEAGHWERVNRLPGEYEEEVEVNDEAVPSQEEPSQDADAGQPGPSQGETPMTDRERRRAERQVERVKRRREKQERQDERDRIREERRLRREAKGRT